MSQDTGGYARHHHAGFHFAGDYGTSAYKSICFDGNTREHDRARSNERRLPNVRSAGQHRARRNVRAVANGAIVRDDR
ncbi:MAG TPA: hypothetical protein VFU90_10275, partial [Candidatus Tumulicola sp.]|nr:hypothetical protein [Candidatus Tumulicola sp.]